MAVENIEVRLFTPEEWPFYKGVRLKALKTDPKVFGSTFAKESLENDDFWKASLLRTDLGVFGVFHFGDVIGMTGLVIDKDDKQAAKLWGSWLEPKWRGKGVSEKMYQARIGWAQKHPDAKKIIVSHRQSNVASKKANQKHGFTFTHATDRTWNDGLAEPELYYHLILKK